PEQPIRKWFSAEVPSSKEIVFRTCAIDGWQFLIINKKHVVAFSPPAIGILEHGHGYPHKMSATSCLHPHIVVLAVELHFRLWNRRIRLGIPILRMEIQCVGRQRRAILAPVNVPVERINSFLTFIRDRYT